MSLHISFDFDPEAPEKIIAQGTDLDAAIQACWDKYREFQAPVELCLNHICITLEQANDLQDAAQHIKADFQRQTIIEDKGDFIETLKQSNQPLDFARDNAAIIAQLTDREARFYHPGQDRYISTREREMPVRAERGFNAR